MAERLLGVVLELEPSHPRATELMARLCLRTERSTDAIVWARKLVALEPVSGAAHFLLGDTLGASGKIVEARAEWQRAGELNAAGKRDDAPAADQKSSAAGL
jgi:Flp pilus assembly protein TadD